MKAVIKRILSLILSCCCIFSVSACGDKENNPSNESSPKIPSCSHTYTSEITKEATCKESGVKTYTCEACGDFYTEDIAKSTTHSYTSQVTKEATCKETGIKTFTCSVCGDSYTETINKTNNHNWNEATCSVAKTCSIYNTTSGKTNAYAHVGGNVKNFV